MFEEFPKIARLSRDCMITEKIDGTNGQVWIVSGADTALGPISGTSLIETGPDGLLMFAGSRTKWVTPTDDNHGFAKWVKANAAKLFELGPGRHYGEWWGSGIQRGYGLPKGEKRFSLFNAGRWNSQNTPSCCSVVPILYQGPFSTEVAGTQIERLRTLGSVASPGFMKPEGIIIWHEAARLCFKKTVDKDEEPKSFQKAQP